MRGGEHRTGRIERAGGEVDQVGRRQPEVDHVDALLEHTPDEGIDELGPRGAHIATDQHSRSIGESGEADTECVGDLGVELIGNGATHIVRFDDGVQHQGVGRGHGA